LGYLGLGKESVVGTVNVAIQSTVVLIFSCHEYPNIQVTQVDYVKPALIVGFAIIIGVLILKFVDVGKIKDRFGRKKEEKKTEVKEEGKPEGEVVSNGSNVTYFNYPPFPYQYSLGGKSEDSYKDSDKQYSDDEVV